MKNRRILNVIFTKGGSGSITTKLSLPKVWIDEMGITQEEKNVVAECFGDKIVIRKANDMDKLIQKIDSAIEKEMARTGKMGTESVSVRILCSDEEKQVFEEIEKYDSENYWWEWEGQHLIITYTEVI